MYYTVIKYQHNYSLKVVYFFVVLKKFFVFVDDNNCFNFARFKVCSSGATDSCTRTKQSFTFCAGGWYSWYSKLEMLTWGPY